MKKMSYLSFFLIISGLVATQSALAITRKTFDFVVGVNGNFKAAITAASNGAQTGARFYIFFPDGEYDIGTLTGDTNQKTTFSVSNVSFIGQSADNTIIFNKSINESIGTTSTLYFNKADNLYLQDLTVLNKANYNQPGTYSQTGRHVAIQEQGNKIIYKNVKLLSTQDTYYTKGTRTYWENGEIHGTTDFICGGGDIFFNECLLYTDKSSCITAPATNTSWGYVFMNCTIDGSVSSYELGRSWGDAKCVFINTTMKKLPTPGGWGNPMNSVPVIFAEYNSKTASGTSVDLSKRREIYTKDNTTVTLNPVLNASQAAKYTVESVLGGSDNWKPNTLTKQVSAPVVLLEGSNLKWSDENKALCWVVFKDGKYYKCVTIPSCAISSTDSRGKYAVRAANSMGGLGTSSNVVDVSVTLCSLTTSVAEGNGTVTPESGSFVNKQSVTITAIPEVGWMFDHWSGDLVGTINPATIGMAADRTVAAHFVRDTRTYYIINKQAGIGGYLTQTPEGSKFVEGTSLTLTAVPNAGWKFSGWTGDHTGTDATYTISPLSSNISVEASFVPFDKSNYEAESGILKDAVPETKNTGFSGDAYVNFSNVVGSSIEISVYVDDAGEKNVLLAFANGSGVSRQLSVSVNGTRQIASVDFEATADWISWQSKQIIITLPQGGSTVTLSTINDLDGPNVDKVIIDQGTPAKVQTVKNVKSVSFYNPAKKVFCINVNASNVLKVNIFSLNGKIMVSKRFNMVSGGGRVEIPLNDLRKGIYLFKVELDGSENTGYINQL